MSEIEKVKTNLQTVQGDVITGSVYDTYTDLSQDIIYGRAPYLGQRVTYRDGRSFVFCSTLVDLPAGTLCGSIVSPTEFAGKLKVAVAGATQIALTAAGVTAGQYAGGFILITESSGQKTTYAIVDNTLTLTVAEGIGAIADIIIDLANPLVGDIAAADDCALYASKYKSVIVGTAATKAIGIPIVTTTVATESTTTTGYQWFQTHGVGGALVGTEAAFAAGVAAMAGTAVVEINNGTREYVGVCLAQAAVTDTDLCLIDLCIQ